ITDRHQHYRGGAYPPFELVELPDRRVDRRGQRRQVLADENQPGGDDTAHAREKIGRRAVIDRDDDNAAEQTAPERDDPLRPVLAPDDNFVALPESVLMQARGEPSRRARDLGIRIPAAAETVVVNEELAARVREIAEKINERVADHE